MNILDESFESAIEIVNKLKDLNNNELLSIYGLFKQAKFGDNQKEKPGMLDFKGQKKWEAWNSFKGVNSDNAKQQYVTLSIKLFKKYNKE